MAVFPVWCQRVAIVAIVTIPLLVLLVLSAPGWLVWPFLPKDNRDSVIQFANVVLDWIKAVVKAK